MKVSVNAPKTPVTAGSMGIAMATIPNVCKMPGPPAPFVPTPLPNIGKSDSSPKDYSKKVKLEGKACAIQGATFGSMGDVASKATGGGLISANTHGPTKFVGPGSFDVKFEGKNVQLLGDPMLNNCAGGGAPANAATLAGVLQAPGLIAVLGDEPCPACGKTHGDDAKLEETEDTQGLCDDLFKAADKGVEDAQETADEQHEERWKAMQAAADEERAEIEQRLEGELPKKVRRALEKRQRKLDNLKEPSKRTVGYTAMAGVVKCKHGEVFAGFSGTQRWEVYQALPAGWHSPKAYATDRLVDKVETKSAAKSRFKEHVGDRLDVLWDACEAGNAAFRAAGGAGFAWYPPGMCAAQQMVVLAMDHQCRPKGLTERWYKNGDPNAVPAGDLWVRDLGEDGKPGPKRKIEASEMGKGKAVPPCETCQIILAALMCTEDAFMECDYKAPKPGVCKCT
ncbi:MAG: PAAR-like domain-containing protein [Myxococcota bacterium]